MIQLGDPIETGGIELRYNCPFCLKRNGTEDTGWHLYMNPEKIINSIAGVFFCQRCGARGSANKLFNIKTEDPPAHKWSEIISRFLHPELHAPVSTAISMPDGVRPVRPNTQAGDYLTSRAISLDTAIFYEMMDWPERQRIIIPIKEHGKLVYWVARSYNGQEPKYLNPKGVPRRSVLFNIDHAGQQDTLVVAEGIISAIAIGRSAIATLSKMITPRQIELIADSKSPNIITCLDPDAINEAVDLCRDLRPFKNVRIAVLPVGSDPADLSYEVLKQVLDTAPVYNDWLGMMARLNGGLNGTEFQYPTVGSHHER